MLPSRSCQCYNRHQHPQHLAGSRPLMALRQLNMHNRPTPSGSQCAATANKAPELTPKEQQLLQCMLNYEYTVDLPEGQLVIQPLRERWLQRTGDLLADTFVDAKGIQPYRRYVRRNIGKYLDQHINMPPAAVVVTAVLRTQVEGSPSTDLGLHDLQTAAGADSDSSSSNSSSKDADKPSSSSSSSSSAGEADADQAPPLGMALGQFLVKRFGWLIKPNTPETRITDGFSSSSSSGLSSVDIEGTNVASADATNHSNSSSSSSSSAADAYIAVTTTDTARSSSTKAQDSSSSSSNSQAAGPNVASLVGSALQRLSDSVSLPQLRLQHKGVQTHVVETLVGVAEVSFRERTRSQALTLNPPQKCGYLCNMAVGKEWRRRGIASQLMTAIEDMCLLAGEADLYLHLRFKDEATAGSLYRKHGFITAKKDCWLLLLVGQEPRFLMLKQLAADRTLAGKVALPGFRHGVTAAELQQEQDQQQQEEAVGGAKEGAAAGGQPAAAPSPAASPAA